VVLFASSHYKTKTLAENFWFHVGSCRDSHSHCLLLIWLLGFDSWHCLLFLLHVHIWFSQLGNRWENNAMITFLCVEICFQWSIPKMSSAPSSLRINCQCQGYDSDLCNWSRTACFLSPINCRSHTKKSGLAIQNPCVAESLLLLKSRISWSLLGCSIIIPAAFIVVVSRHDKSGESIHRKSKSCPSKASSIPNIYQVINIFNH
jgi:hypothetical protein